MKIKKDRCVWWFIVDYLLGERRIENQGKNAKTLSRISIQTNRRI
jgi:hypothetical protein